MVKIANFTYHPNKVAVTPATSVTWTNEDDIPTRWSPQAFRSQALHTEDSFAFRFTKTAKPPNFCSLHPHTTWND